VPKLSLSKAWDETQVLLPRDGKLFAAVSLALLVLPSTIFGTVAPGALMGSARPEGMIGVLVIVVALIGLVGRIAIASLALKPTAVGEAISQALRRTPAAAAAFVLFLIPIGLLLSPFLPAILLSPDNPPSGPLMAATLIMLVAFILGVRLVLLLVPVASAEKIGVIALLKRSWILSSGNWWRLAIFLVIFLTGSIIAARAIGFVLGGALILFVGPLQPMTVSALILAVVLSFVGAAITTVFSMMLARIYAQLSAGQPSVPEVKREE